MSTLNPGLTFLGLPDDDAYRRGALFRVLSVPYDLTQSGWVGARYAPAAILTASTQFEEWDPEIGVNAAARGIATLGQVPVNVSGPEAMIADIERAASGLIERGHILATLGGEHSITLGLVRAHLARHPDLTVVVLDAHPDLRDQYQGSAFSHASVMRRVSELAPVITVGYRSLSEEERAFLEHAGAPHASREVPHPVAIPAWEMKPDPRAAWSRIAPRVGPKVYLSLDIDVMDPALVPAVGTPEPGGLTWEEMNAFLGALVAEREVVGLDLVELLPIPEFPAPNLIAAKLLYRVFGLIARAR